MDYRQAPCPDSDFAGYNDKQSYAPVTGEYKVPRTPVRHPSELMFYLVAGSLGFLVVLIVIGFLAVVGTVARWLF